MPISHEMQQCVGERVCVCVRERGREGGREGGGVEWGLLPVYCFLLWPMSSPSYKIGYDGQNSSFSIVVGVYYNMVAFEKLFTL